MVVRRPEDAVMVMTQAPSGDRVHFIDNLLLECSWRISHDSSHVGCCFTAKVEVASGRSGLCPERRKEDQEAPMGVG